MVETSFGGRKPSKIPVIVTSTTRDYEKGGAIPKSPKTIFSEREKNQDDSEIRIKSYFPDANTSKFIHGYDEYGQLTVKLSRRGAKTYPLLKGDKLNDELPDTIIKSLGADYETMLRKNKNLSLKLNKLNKKNIELLNEVQGLRETTKVYPLDISRYEEKEKKLREFIEKQQMEKAEKISVEEQKNKRLLEEMKGYKEEIDKYKRGKSNLTTLERGNERLQAEVDKFTRTNKKEYYLQPRTNS